MKKIVLLLIPFALSMTAIAQRTETKGTQTKKTSREKTDAKSQSTAILDGMSFKITLTQKDESMSSGSSRDQSMSSGTSGNKADQDVNGIDRSGNASNSRDMSSTKGPLENPQTGQNQSGQNQMYSDWNNAKGKLQFDNGTVKLSLNNKDIALASCPYSVTSGTADLATF